MIRPMFMPDAKTLVVVLVSLAAAALSTMGAAAQLECQAILTPDAADAISAQIGQLRDELRQVQNSSPDEIVKGTDNVTVRQYIQTHRLLLQRLTDCLADAEIEPSGRSADAEEVPTPPAEPLIPTRGSIAFIEWEAGGVCVLRSAYCIDMEGNEYRRGESPPPADQPAPQEGASSASVAAPAAPLSFAGNWTGRFSGPIGAGGCQTTESGSFGLRLDQPTPGGPVTGTASYNGNIVPRSCGSVSLGGADTCASAQIGPATPSGNTLRFQLACAGSTETVNLQLDSTTAASGNKFGRSGEVSWDMTFALIR